MSRHRGSLIELQVSSLGCKQKQRGDTCENGVRQAAFDCVCLRPAVCHLKRCLENRGVVAQFDLD
ncbi:hypothetical protein ALO57_100397 [Pseudomonas coronafaciens pv. oryzae]|nr:hypothetical protein ALO57_100397 [Pseudomonas coronafaciens pv. oryzae]KPZ26635.1 hypothetical protein ALO38_100323 [Pseudomonas coronafaciens pv. zizaniae]RMS88377.1 hypothetical protein ALP57_100593 [Pseudomonas coronafaciens pv. oryzae]RMS95684.1 hypothetical protein ALP56_100468 [Pseudomonas coronafaciens pv. oryzae]RMT10883.1 hypothetical protein ALP55_100695 [Pseudomonas coronafaciens pv. oryzae]